jgi:hypothetical protein
MASLLTRHNGTRRDRDFAGNESVMVDAHYRAGARILRVFRKAGRGRQSGEQEGHSQSAKDALRLASAQPEGSYPICSEVHGITGYQDQSPRNGREAF